MEMGTEGTPMTRLRPFTLLFLFYSLISHAGMIDKDCANLYLKPQQIERKIKREFQRNLKPQVFPQVEALRVRRSLKTVFPHYDDLEIEQVMKRLRTNLHQQLSQRPAPLLVNDYHALRDGKNRIKEGVEYMFYVDQFGGDGLRKTTTFDDAIEKIDYLKEMGVDTIYPLPFLKSPGKDGGFDVSDFRAVNDMFGGDEAFDRFIKAAKEKEMTVKMDLILNHVSEGHTWFKKFLDGDMKYKDYFVTRDTPPQIVKRFENEQGSWVRYQELDEFGNKVEIDRRLIFPDIADTHYRKVQVNMPGGQKKDYWVYHTFFPFQLDLNFANPDVLVEGLDILGYWANKGIDVFRLDAIPFLTKSAENHPKTHAVIEVFQAYLDQLSPSSVLMVEANQPPQELIEYFGKSIRPKHAGLDREMEGTSRAIMGYNFGEIPFMEGFLSGNKKNIENVLNSFQKLDIPKDAAFTNFVRVHDEFTLEMVSPEVRKSISQALLSPDGKKGIPFREGEDEFFGVAGRLANFLDENPERIKSVYSLLFGRPGKPVIFSGDEFGQVNNWEYMISEAEQRMKFMVDNNIPIQPIEGKTRAFFEQLNVPVTAEYNGRTYPLPIDARDANRGPLSDDKLYKAVHDPDSPEGAVFSKIKELIRARNENPVIRQGQLQLINHNNQHVLAYKLVKNNEEVVVLINLTDNRQVFKGRLSQGSYQDLISNEMIHYTNGMDLEAYGTVWLRIK
jgi:maltose alpha-D-glucosyltransferase / alpha-amylase